MKKNDKNYSILLTLFVISIVIANVVGSRTITTGIHLGPHHPVHIRRCDHLRCHVPVYRHRRRNLGPQESAEHGFLWLCRPDFRNHRNYPYRLVQSSRPCY